MKRTPLRADPEKTREWLRRSSRGRKKRERLPVSTREAAYRRSAGWCVACLHREGGEGLSRARRRQLGQLGRLRRAAHPHHVFTVAAFPQLQLEEDNIVGLCEGCHAQHHEPGVSGGRLPWLALPECARRLVARVSLADPLAEAYALRTYPGFEPDLSNQ